MEIHNTSSLKLRFFSSKALSMAFETYEWRHFDFYLFEPLICPEAHHPPLPFQIELTLSIGFLCIRHDCRTGELIGSSVDNSMSPETLRFDLDLLRNYNHFHPIIASVLTRLGLNPTSRFSANLIQEIIERGLRFGRGGVAGGEGKILRLRAEILATLRVHVNNEEDSINRVLSESASEFEVSNYGMVPAKESLVKKILKKVSVEVEKEDCMICLEELEVGSEASQMPCSHTFHYDCIEKWLKLSHYCPICRFEMPS